jgi:hypothetical protein
MSILMYKQRFRPPNYKKTPKCNYAHIRYIATRPGASKNEGMRHGLFGKLSPGAISEFENWQSIAKEIRELSYKKVNIFRSIISFSPQTAEELGLKQHRDWEEYVEKHIGTIAQKNGISLKNIAWVCAHHNEQSHPHVHIVFWDKEQKTMKNFVHPKIADSIRIQLIKDTFADKIEEYCQSKDKSKAAIRNITEELVKEFDDYMKSLHHKEYKHLKEVIGDIEQDEFLGHDFNEVINGMDLSPLSIRLFQLRELMPKKGRLYYQLLPENVKTEVDRLVADLKQNILYIQELVEEYGEIKAKLAMLYDTDPESTKLHRDKAIKEMDKMIANKLLGAVKIILNKEQELLKEKFTEDRRAYYTEQMICGILQMLEQNLNDLDMDFDVHDKAISTELSKRAKKEIYLKNRDKGITFF